MRKILGTALIFACLGSSAFGASLPLKPGGYVAMGTRCSEGSDATSIDYLGGTIQAGNMTMTNERVTAHQGNTYQLSATVMDNQAGTSQVATDTVTIRSPTAFRLMTQYGSADYRWCRPDSGL